MLQLCTAGFGEVLTVGLGPGSSPSPPLFWFRDVLRDIVLLEGEPSAQFDINQAP